MKPLGIALVVLGVLAFVFGGFHYDTQKTVLDMGPIKATATERHDFPLSKVVAGIAVVAGLILVLAPSRRPN